MQNYFRHLDYVMLAAAASICAFGLWILRNATHNDPGGLYSKQVLYMAVGWVALLVIAAIPPRFLRRLSWPLYGFVLFTTSVVLVLGTTVQGGTRWISLGPFQFQPSEFAKLFLIVGLASVLAARRGLVSPTRLTWIAIGYIGLPALLVFLDPDFGTTLVLVTVMMGMLFVFGAPWRHFLYIGVVLGVSIALVFSVLPGVGVQVLQKYQRDRWTAFLNPQQNQQDSYHLRQSLIAISHGGAGGTGAAGAHPDQARLPARAHDRFHLRRRRRGARLSRRRLADRPLCPAVMAWAQGDHLIEIDLREPGRGRYRECIDVPDLHQHRDDDRTGADHRHPVAVHEFRRVAHPGGADVDRRPAGDSRARVDSRRASTGMSLASLKERSKPSISPRPSARWWATVQTALGVVREVRDGTEVSRPILVCGRGGPAAKARAALLEGGGDEDLVRAFALRRLRPEDAERMAGAALVIYAGEVTDQPRPRDQRRPRRGRRVGMSGGGRARGHRYPR